MFIGGVMEVTQRKKVLKAILRSLENGAGIQAACKAAGITTMSFWRWRKKNPKLDKLVATLLEGQIEIVEDALYKSALAGNTTAQIFFLTNRAPERWKDRRAIEHSGDIKITKIEVKVVKDGNHKNKSHNRLGEVTASN